MARLKKRRLVQCKASVRRIARIIVWFLLGFLAGLLILKSMQV